MTVSRHPSQLFAFTLALALPLLFSHPHHLWRLHLDSIHSPLQAALHPYFPSLAQSSCPSSQIYRQSRDPNANASQHALAAYPLSFDHTKHLDSMSAETSAPPSEAVAPPVSFESSNTASAQDQELFGASILSKKEDALTTEPAQVEQPQAEQPEASTATTADADQHDIAAVAAAAAAAAAAADASSAAQTITELATAATNAANNAASATPAAVESLSADVEAAAATAAAADASEAAPARVEEAGDQQDAAVGADGAVTAEPVSNSGLPSNVESELREIYSVASAIANFSVAHVNQVNVPTPQKVRNIIQKALKLTSSLSMLLAQPEVALRQLDAEESGKRPAESKLDSARKRPRSSDWDGTKIELPHGAGLPITPYTHSSGLKVFPDGSLSTSFPSPGFDSDQKGPQYKKRSRAPAPGSCQACGTTETPEWRRGPDGARTLCNACGLHYAKLVRKRLQQEGVEEPMPRHTPAQMSLVSLEELRASTKSAEAAAAAGLTPSASSTSLNGTPIKVDAHEAWNTPSKPPRVSSSLSSVVAASSENDSAQNQGVPQPPASAPTSADNASDTAGIVESAPTRISAGADATPHPASAPEPVIAPELAAEAAPINHVDTNHAQPMQTDH